jgi:hypothetical protein
MDVRPNLSVSLSVSTCSLSHSISLSELERQLPHNHENRSESRLVEEKQQEHAEKGEEYFQYPEGVVFQPSHLKLVFDQSTITPKVYTNPYKGSGTEQDPYRVEFLPEDPRNALQYPTVKKWILTNVVALATLAVSFASSAYSGAITKVIAEFGCSEETATLGTSLFVLGFALGPLIWAPISELYGRQVVFIGTYGALAVLSAGTAACQNIETVLALRFFAGAFGASSLTNAGGVIADMFEAEERGLAVSKLPDRSLFQIFQVTYFEADVMLCCQPLPRPGDRTHCLWLCFPIDRMAVRRRHHRHLLWCSLDHRMPHSSRDIWPRPITKKSRDA